MRKNEEKLSLQIQQKDLKAIEARYTGHTQQSDIDLCKMKHFYHICNKFLVAIHQYS